MNAQARVAALMVLFAASGCLPEDDQPELASTTSAVNADIVHMQIVAHPDDDFLFMNPDLVTQIQRGFGIVTIYVTAGEANGSGNCAVETARAEHAIARQRAVKAAYAQMANPSYTAAQADAAYWWSELIVPDPDVPWPHTVQRYTLGTHPNIRLIFMNLREDGEWPRPAGTYTIGEMFGNPALQTNTIVPSCGDWRDTACAWTSCGNDPPWQNYTKESLITVLLRLVELYQPAVIRTLDPQPFEKLGYHSNVCPGGGLYDVCFDNLDHTAVARYVNAVLGSYHGPNGSGRHSVVHYKGYSFINYPRNLGTGNYLDKRKAGEAYRLSYPGDAYYSDSVYDPYYAVQYERYPGSTNWVERAKDGRLVAVNVQDRQVKLWYENSVGGTWTGPVNLGGGAPIAPHVTLLRRPDGRLQIFATRLPLGMELASPVAPYQEVISAIQNNNKMTFGAWQVVGAPDTGRFTGVATAAIDGNGRTFVFARDSSGLPVYAYQSGTTWSAFAPLNAGVEDVMDGIAAITRDDGVIEVFATSRRGQVQRYVQAGTTFSYAADPMTFNFWDAASPPTVTKNQDGRLQIFYRERTTNQYGRVLTAWVSPSGQWTGPAILYGDAGVGPIAAIRRGGTGHIMLFQRNAWGGISLTAQQAPNGAFLLQWDLRSGAGSYHTFLEYPAATTDNLGRVVFLTKHADGRLYFQRESSAGAVGGFGAWVIAGT